MAAGLSHSTQWLNHSHAPRNNAHARGSLVVGRGGTHLPAVHMREGAPENHGLALPNAAHIPRSPVCKADTKASCSSSRQAGCLTSTVHAARCTRRCLRSLGLMRCQHCARGRWQGSLAPARRQRSQHAQACRSRCAGCPRCVRQRPCGAAAALSCGAPACLASAAGRGIGLASADGWWQCRPREGW